MNYIKAFFGLCCFLILIISSYWGISVFIGHFITEEELKDIVSFFCLLVVGWGFYNYEKEIMNKK